MCVFYDNLKKYFMPFTKKLINSLLYLRTMKTHVLISVVLSSLLKATAGLLSRTTGPGGETITIPLFLDQIFNCDRCRRAGLSSINLISYEPPYSRYRLSPS